MKRITPSWQLPASGRALLVLGALGWMAAALGCDRLPGKSAAAALTATPQAVTLIQEAKTRCVKVAKTGLEKLRDAEEEERRKQEEALESGKNNQPRLRWGATETMAEVTLEKYLKDEAAPELAAVDRAGDLIRGFMPEVGKEASPEIAQAVQALLNSEEQVCQRIRGARSTRSSYQENLDYVVRDYDAAEAKLQLLYTMSSTDSQFALNKYKPMLDQVSASTDRHSGNPMRPLTPDQLREERREWEATQELLQQQQAQHDAAVVRWRQREEGKTPIMAKIGDAPELAAKENLSPEKRQQTMQTWHAGYTSKAAPVRAAFASFMSNRRGPDSQLMPICQTLLDATAALNADVAALDPPDVTVARTLKKAYTELQESARACLNGQSAESAFRLSYYQGAIAQAASAMQPYSLTP
ncbi:MAG TPA: hypothetical protein VLB76_04730 [Thermoanaerobaculia bacterium]|jgi:hypothetical protein|nr:hypothetical protein [Thermoanaerobaculia bacterium]